MKSLNATIVIPAYNETRNIIKVVNLILNLDLSNVEVLIIVDQPNDLTISAVSPLKINKNLVKVLVQTYGPGPANAIRFGIDNANSECVIVMMADGSDDARVIPELINLVNRGVVIACASRYMSGGQQIGGPRVKKFLSKSAGKILFLLAGVGTHDPTNSFKAYSRKFVEDVGIESRSGFEIGIELVAKAKRARMPIAEIPTIWLDRSTGESRFLMTKWIPKYLKWFFYCFGPKIKISNQEQEI